ncbi:MAG: hypothetical protein WA939_04415 [Nodosilinea sp.]
MTYSNNIADIETVYQLLISYSFDAESYQIKAIVADWLTEFGPIWVSHAITEALYQGRYKLISIDQILKLWQRRGQPIRHFNREFESIILGQTLLYSTGYSDRPDPSTLRRTTTSASPQPAPPASKLELARAESGQADLTREEPATAATQSNPFDKASAFDQANGLEAVKEPAVAEASAAEEATEIRTALEAPADASSHTGKDPADETHPEVPDFRPIAPEESSPCHQVEVIQPFVPQRGESDLHERLRAVVQGSRQE